MITLGSLKVISVTGAHSGVGKTTLCSILLRELKGFGAIKFTRTPLYSSLIDDTAVLNQKGKDTARFLASGAERVLWIQSPYDQLEDLLKIAIDKMAELKGVIIEGNSPVDFLNPCLVLFIIGADGEIKPSARKAGEKADSILINSAQQVKEPEVLTPVKQKNVTVFRIDLIKRKGDINEFLSFCKKRID